MDVFAELRDLADRFDKHIYIVGGFVRDTLAELSPHDVDITGDIDSDEVIKTLSKTRYKVKITSQKLMTLKIIGDNTYEFTAFRADSYTDGHTPEAVKRTSDIKTDALRRDFTMNAVYYDVKKGEYVDVIGGIADIEAKIVRYTRENTFEEDGLRLMRLCRQAAESGFGIEEKTLLSARRNAKRINEISPERIREELDKILSADLRYGIADAHVRGLELLDEIGVLEEILPEIVAGKGVEQRSDYHKFDVYGHITETVRKADPSVRLAALLHDVAKPYCKATFGRFKDHAIYGVETAKKILKKLRYPNKTSKEVCFLVGNHMYDMNCRLPESEVRKFLQRNYNRLDKLFLLKQADYEGGGILTGECPAVAKHKKILAEMEREKVPFSLKELSVDGNDLANAGVPEKLRGKILQNLMERCALDGSLNDKEKLTEIIKKEIKNAD